MDYNCMEERALKSSLRRELAMKSSQQAFCEDFSCFNASNGLVSTEDFPIECFFDFSNGEFKDGHIHEQYVEEEEEEKDNLSDSSQDRVDDDNNSNFSCVSDSFLSTELAVPADELADLEWVSHFVDDSLPEVSLLFPAGEEKTESHTNSKFEQKPKPALTKTPCFFPFRVPAKARSKRPRPTGRTWSTGSPLTESSSSSTSPSSSTSCLIFTDAVQSFDFLHGFNEPPTKKSKKKPAVQTGGMMGSGQFQRRCSHCQVQKTPQWRTGPQGAKTLCNACGVRYKSGRLFPEYRPACSPTFSDDIHSNSHRKVLEIRKRKETGRPESSWKQMVPSF